MNAISTRGSVVVGVDGTATNRGALRYAVQECRRTGAALELVHVLPDLVAVSPLVPMVPADLTPSGAAVLARAVADVRALGTAVEPTTRLRHGTRAAELLRAAEDARALVVGRDDRPVGYRLVDGDTATRVAARASVPVVEVPPEWRERGVTEPDGGVVVVGVKSPAHAAAVLGQAFAVADVRGARLVVLHAWHLPSAYDDIIEGRVAREQVEREGTAEVQELLHPWLVAYPDVAATVRIVHDRPAHALVAASREADLLVIVRRGHGVPAAVHLGGTARAALRHAACPVMVVPPSQVPDAPPLALEAEGQAMK
ncbi:universal stress protein [Nocardioides caricicola]|uniref:Universal stress protein n=1 Tax=Nocardioides caricicola TaxID=634770 RepID=A0ABW0NA31_9ACTN